MIQLLFNKTLTQVPASRWWLAISQLSVTPVSRAPMHSSGLWRLWVCVVPKHTCRQNAHTCKNLNIVKITEWNYKKITNLKSIFIPSIVVHFVIPVLVRQRKAELCEFRAALSLWDFWATKGYSVKPCLKIQKAKNKKNFQRLNAW